MPYPNPYSTDFFENMPLYAQMADEKDVLKHVAGAPQPTFNAIVRRLEQLRYQLNPSHPASADFLDYVGQWVGLAIVEGKWLGYGLNPDWTPTEKRRVLLRAWQYWQMKGTEWGIREAMLMWLGWELSHDRDRQQIIHPFSKRPTNAPHSWWTYDTGYDAHLYQTYPERQHLGSGDYSPGVDYQAQHWYSLRQPAYQWDYEATWSDRVLESSPPGVVPNSTSHLGMNRPWQHLFIETEAEWQQLFPNLYDLTPEIWSSQAIPTIFAWWVAKLPTLILEENRQAPKTQTVVEFDVDGIHYGDWYPYDCAPERQEQRTTTIEEEFGEVGCDYFDQWAGLEGHPIFVGDRLVAEEIIGIYPGCEYERDWYSALRLTPTAVVSLVEIDGNFQGLNWTGWQSEQWYFPPYSLSLTTVNPVAAIASGTAPYYCPTQTIERIITGEFVPSEPYPGIWWTAFPRSLTRQETETFTIPAIPCTPGMLADIIVGTQEWTIVHDAVPAAQLLEITPSHTEVTSAAQPGAVVGFQWMDWWLGFDGTLPPTVVDIFASDDFSDRWYSARFPEVSPTIIETRSRWALEQPTRIADNFYGYEATCPWYAMGTAQELEQVELPAWRRVQLCNVVDNWTLRQIIYWREYQVLIPESDLYSIVDIYPMLRRLLNGNEWQLFLETTSQIVVVSPSTVIWTKPADDTMRSSQYSQAQGFTRMLLEFAIQPTFSDYLRSLTLKVDGIVIYQKSVDNLDFQPKGTFGFRFFLPTEPEPSPLLPPSGGLPVA